MKQNLISKKIMVFSVVLVLIILIGFTAFKQVNKSTYQKPPAWTISQSVYSTIGKQKLLSNFAQDGELTVGEIAKVATSSTTVTSEVVKVGDKYLLSTGSDGQVKINLPQGLYKMAVMPIPGMDFTGVSDQVKVEGRTQIMFLGLKKGSGEINSRVLSVITEPGSGDLKNTDLVIKLFHDKNGDAVNQDGESGLSWAGVTFRLTPVK